MKVFLYKENSEDRDCVAYIESVPSRFECGHYFSSVRIEAACYSGGMFADYESIKTILTETEYNQLLQFAKDIEELGFGITKGDDRYIKGVELCKSIQLVYDRLLSDENQNLFLEVQDEETEFLMNEYGFTDDDIKNIFNSYPLEYRDRSIVSAIYRDAYELGEEEAYSIGIINTQMNNGSFHYSRYFDFEAFGEDLIDDTEGYVTLDDQRVVCLNL